MNSSYKLKTPKMPLVSIHHNSSLKINFFYKIALNVEGKLLYLKI